MKRKLGQMIADSECHCIQFSSIPDPFCLDCLGTGEIQKKQKGSTEGDTDEQSEEVK